MDLKSYKKAVFEAAEKAGLTEYEIYYQGCAATVISTFKQEVSDFSSHTDGGLCFRCIYGGKMGYASTECFEDASGLVARAMDNAAVLEAEEQVFLAQGGQNYRKWTGRNYKLPDTKKLMDMVLESQSKLYAAGAADGTTTRGISEENVIEICNSKGLDVRTKVDLCALVISAVVEGENEKANEYKIAIGDPNTMDISKLTGEVVANARQKLGGAVPATGACPVVFAPKAMADLLSVFADTFFANRVQKGLSKMPEEGTVVAAPCVTIVDDPFHPQSPMPMAFDGEGSPTKTKKVIEDGVLKTLLYNLKSANVAGKKTTGNGSKAGYDSNVGTRTYSMYLCGGELTEEQLLQQAGDGIYITNLMGLHAGANSVTGDFSLQSAGFLIENGVKTGFIKGFTVAGNFFGLLQNIRALADNSHLPDPVGMTAYGAPSTLVDGLTVAGK